MSKRGINIVGVNALAEKLKKNATTEDVKKVVKENTKELNRKMVQKAKFEGHFEGDVWMTPTGATRRSITAHLALNGMQGKVFPTTKYAFYLEYGTRFMSSQPFVGPAYRQQKPIFLSDMQRLVK